MPWTNSRLFSTSSSPLGNSTQPSTESSETTDEPRIAPLQHRTATAMNQGSGYKMTRSASTRRVDTNVHGCLRFNHQCLSECCIDGQCVDSSQCEPVKAPRGGPPPIPGGGVSHGVKSSIPGWAVLAIIGGIILLSIPINYYYCHKR